MKEYELMLQACAKIVKFAITQNLHKSEKKVIAKMLVEGFRKAHDKAESSFGLGKFLGHTIWSEKALLRLNEIEKINKSLTNFLRHEHAVPLIYLAEKILLAKDPSTSIDEILILIKRYGRVVIIERVEDRELSFKNTMPDNWDGIDIFARYKENGVFKFKLIDRETGISL